MYIRVNAPPPKFGELGFVEAVIGALSTVYAGETQKKIAAKQREHEKSLQKMQEQTERLKIALQQRQMELLQQAQAPAGGSASPATAALGGVGSAKILLIVGAVGALGYVAYTAMQK